MFRYMHCVLDQKYVNILDGDSSNVYTNPTSMRQLPWWCNFGSNIEQVDYCGFIQDDTDDMEWIPIVGPTPTNYTGPPESSLDEHGMETKPFLPI